VLAFNLRLSRANLEVSMETVTGIFDSRAAGERTFSALAQSTEFDRDHLLLLTPEETDAAEKIEAIPTDEGEQPGMGSALGGVVGGAVGLASGAVLSNLVLPGVGPVLTLTLSAGGGLGGALLGAFGGSAAERALSTGLPKDEVFVYEDALRRCRTLVVAQAESRDAAETARSIMERNRAESVDAAREKWWIGIRDGEAAHYGDGFVAREAAYRAGFEAAVGECRSRSFESVESELRQRYPDHYAEAAFRRGYERGCEYLRSFQHARADSPAAQR
jgi:hypothetical protein